MSSASHPTRSTRTSSSACWRRGGRLSRDDPKRAAERLREGLGLWHGPPLADLAYESFTQPEIARLDELRLTALEERIDADLTLGRDDELIGELEALVERNPLRERLRGQLMLALYRAGRQARRSGVPEPSTSRPSLGSSRASRCGASSARSSSRLRSSARRGGDRGRRLSRLPRGVTPGRIAVAGALLLAVALGAGAWRLAGGDEGHESAGAIVLDPDTGAIRAEDLLRHLALDVPSGREASGCSTATTRP